MQLAIKCNSNQMTRLLCSISYSHRCRLAELSQSLGISQQALIRSAIGQFLATCCEPVRNEAH
jgi:hypothetical protein